MRDQRPGPGTGWKWRARAGTCLAVALLCAVATAAHAFGPYDEKQLSKEKRGAHGALSMAAQMKVLDQLLPERDVTKPPPGVDPEMWAFFVPKDNEMTPERVALGRKLYFEPRLSADDTVACATCHDVTRGFTDQRPTSEGVRDQLGHRNAPTTMNAVLLRHPVPRRPRRRASRSRPSCPPSTPSRGACRTTPPRSPRSPAIPRTRRRSSRPTAARPTSTTWPAPSPPSSARWSSWTRPSTASSPATTAPSPPRRSAAGFSSTARRAASAAT